MGDIPLVAQAKWAQPRWLVKALGGTGIEPVTSTM